MPKDAQMFDDDTPIGRWSAFATRLDETAVLHGWSTTTHDLSDLCTVEDLLREWRDPARTNQVLLALVRLAAVDGDRDDDALLLTVHLLSGVVRRLVGQLGDLSDDIEAIVVAELCCQIRRYPWWRRSGGVVSNLYAETRRAVLADVRPSCRRHPEWGESVTLDGDVMRLAPRHERADDNLDVLDLLEWAVRDGVQPADVALLIATECARDEHHHHAAERVAAAHGIGISTLYRRRARTLSALRSMVPRYLDAVA